ncbi:hypothetical protein ON010_g10121 [Phytophthora cinnamomi]|nr:hypothetical protein ON010_g10121 [Phytophthora cinnamomi]
MQYTENKAFEASTSNWSYRDSSSDTDYESSQPTMQSKKRWASVKRRVNRPGGRRYTKKRKVISRERVERTRRPAVSSAASSPSASECSDGPSMSVTGANIAYQIVPPDELVRVAGLEWKVFDGWEKLEAY